MTLQRVFTIRYCTPTLRLFNIQECQKRRSSDLSKSQIKELGKSKIIPMLSAKLPACIELAKRKELATKMWSCWNKEERKSIVVAHERSLAISSPPKSNTSLKECSLGKQSSTNLAPDLECWVDASSVPGYATVLIHNYFKVFRFAKCCDADSSQDHSWEETVALELAARTAITLGFSNSRIRVRSQSKAAIRTFNEIGHGKESVKESVARLRCLLKESGTELTCIHVLPEDNRARAFSVGTISKGYTKMPCEVYLPVILMPLVGIIV